MAAAKAQPNPSVGPTRMPTSRADSRFDDTARNANPTLVRDNSRYSSPTTANTVPRLPMVRQVSWAMPHSMGAPLGNMLGRLRVRNPHTMPTAESMMSNSPSVTITSGSTWSGGNGRMNTRSMNAATTALATMAHTTATATGSPCSTLKM